MSLRQQNLGSIIKPGFNPLAAPTPSYTYYLNSWGTNTNGQLGLGNTTAYSSPKQVGSLTNWSFLSTGAQAATIAIKTDGTMWSWGKNNYGVLGLGDTTSRSSPVQIGALTNWLYVSAGYSHCAAVKTDGTLWTWGRNQAGALGIINTTNYSSPKQVGALTNWLRTAANGYTGFTLAIKTDGTLWSWGGNNYGQQGRGNTSQTESPNQVGALTNWSTVVASIGNFVIATKTDGTLWSWGRNVDGALGLGNRTYYSSPKQVGALSTWLKVATGYCYVASVKTDGTLWTWGRSSPNGQLGLGNLTNYSSPKQVGSLTSWLNIAAGYYFNLASKTDGTLWSWGIGGSGSLGLNNRTNYSSPKQVGSLTNWGAVSCTTNSSFALAY